MPTHGFVALDISTSRSVRERQEEFVDRHQCKKTKGTNAWSTEKCNLNEVQK